MRDGLELSQNGYVSSTQVTFLNATDLSLTGVLSRPMASRRRLWLREPLP